MLAHLGCLSQSGHLCPVLTIHSQGLGWHLISKVKKISLAGVQD